MLTFTPEDTTDRRLQNYYALRAGIWTRSAETYGLTVPAGLAIQLSTTNAGITYKQGEARQDNTMPDPYAQQPPRWSTLNIRLVPPFAEYFPAPDDKTSHRAYWVAANTRLNAVVLATARFRGASPITVTTVPPNRDKGAGYGALWRVNLAESQFPPVSHGVYIFDYLLNKVGDDTFLIFRYPLILYNDRYLRDNRDGQRTHDRQRRESELIQASYQRLDRRHPPYSFFVPAEPLDAFRASSDYA